MVEITEAMKRLGITQEVIQRWQEDDDSVDDPAPYQTRGDTLILEQRRAEWAAKQAATGGPNGNGAHNGHGAYGTAPEAVPGEEPAKAQAGS